MSMRLWIASFTFLAAFGFATSSASATPPSRDRVRELLSGFEGGASHATWAALGEEALPVIIDVYNTTSEAPFVRMRAVSAAANFPTEATRTFLRTVANQHAQSELMIREAITAMTRAFGESATADVLPFLNHSSATVRLGTVRALATLRTATVTHALRERLRTERDASVRAEITHVTAH